MILKTSLIWWFLQLFQELYNSYRHSISPKIRLLKTFRCLAYRQSIDWSSSNYQSTSTIPFYHRSMPSIDDDRLNCPAGPQASSSSTRGGGGARGWAGATATPLGVSKLETLCTPSEPPAGAPPGPALAPVQRFLACVYMKRTLQRFVQQEEFVSSLLYSFMNNS